MSKHYHYEIGVEGHLPDNWSDWFQGLEFQNLPSGKATLSGSLPDQAALLAVFNQLQALNLTIISMQRSDPKVLED